MSSVFCSHDKKRSKNIFVHAIPRRLKRCHSDGAIIRLQRHRHRALGAVQAAVAPRRGRFCHKKPSCDGWSTSKAEWRKNGSSSARGMRPITARAHGFVRVLAPCLVDSRQNPAEKLPRTCPIACPFWGKKTLSFFFVRVWNKMSAKMMARGCAEGLNSPTERPFHGQ